jgi:uncharacterized membrane protein YecN with MAPEG domain
MTYPLITSGYAALLALVFVALSARVVADRVTFKVNHGDGGNIRLNRRIRAHANFAEYVPFILFLVALLEARATSRFTIHALLLPLLIARIAHPFGMLAPENTMRQFAFRGASVVVTWIVLAAAALLLLLDLA